MGLIGSYEDVRKLGAKKLLGCFQKDTENTVKFRGDFESSAEENRSKRSRNIGGLGEEEAGSSR